MELLESDIVIIGSGPAGLGCALTLAEDTNNLSVRVLDCGRNYTRRYCPVDNQGICRGCNDICNVISGFGGSIHYGDGVKLSGFPSGRRLLELLGESSAYANMQKAIEFLIGKESVDFQLPQKHDLPFDLKSYPVQLLGSSAIRSAIQRFYEILNTSKNIDLHLGTEAISIRPNNGKFDVISKVSSFKNEVIFRARKVVVAVGRKGFLWWRQELRRLGLIYQLPISSVGLRFECPNGFLKQAARIHPDFKTTIYEDGWKFKTFCFCGGAGGGRVKFTDYGEFTLLDGHVSPEIETSAQPENFALLVQLKDKEGQPRSFEWILENILKPYKHLNPERPGKPITQWYPDFRRSQLSCNSISQFVSLSGFNPSVCDLKFANLASIFPETHKAFCSVFENLLMSFLKINEGGNLNELDIYLQQVAVMGLELESLWDEVIVDYSMQSSLKNLYVIGDCNGMAQGILQSMASGIATANHCLEQEEVKTR